MIRRENEIRKEKIKERKGKRKIKTEERREWIIFQGGASLDNHSE
jgi:hypothetical protein